MIEADSADLALSGWKWMCSIGKSLMARPGLKPRLKTQGQGLIYEGVLERKGQAENWEPREQTCSNHCAWRLMWTPVI